LPAVALRRRAKAGANRPSPCRVR